MVNVESSETPPNGSKSSVLKRVYYALLAIGFIVLVTFGSVFYSWQSSTRGHMKSLQGMISSLKSVDGKLSAVNSVDAELEEAFTRSRELFADVEASIPFPLRVKGSVFSYQGAFEGVYEPSITNVKNYWDDTEQQIKTEPLEGAKKNELRSRIANTAMSLNKNTDYVYNSTVLTEYLLVMTMLGLGGICVLSLVSVFLGKPAKRSDVVVDARPAAGEQKEALADDNSAAKKEISELHGKLKHVRGLCDTLFNDRKRALCVMDADGEILMSNECFVSFFGGEEANLNKLLIRLLDVEMYRRVTRKIREFFNHKGPVARESSIDGFSLPSGLKFKEVYLQPFNAQDGELCALVSFERAGGRSVISSGSEAREKSQDGAESLKSVYSSDSSDSKDDDLVIVPILAELADKLASIKDKEVSLHADEFDEALIPELWHSSILETLGQALKFSIPYSLEFPADRVSFGKGRVGNISISTEASMSLPGLDKPGVILSFKDDGNGPDIAKIHKIAKRAGLTSKKDPSSLTKNEVLGFLFSPAFGFSKSHSSDLTNLVKLKGVVMNQLKGKMRLSYVEEQSFSFQLYIPLER